MNVSELLEDLQAAFEQFPDARDWRVGVASHADQPGGEISVMYVASVHSDSDEELFLVPEGYGEFYDLAEAPLTAGGLLVKLQAETDWAGFVAYTRSKVTELADGSVVSMNMPLWGCGAQPSAQLVYFYFGPGAPEATTRSRRTASPPLNSSVDVRFWLKADVYDKRDAFGPAGSLESAPNLN